MNNLSETVAVIFWALALAVPIYSYFLFPIILALLARVRGEYVVTDPANDSSVILLFSACNEAGVIEDQILSSLALAYPREQLQIMGINDGSTDGTSKIGFRGLVKIMAKSIIYRFCCQSDIDELVGDKIRRKYFLALFKDISRFREKRERWGTHFGFDYRIVDRFFRTRKVQYSAINSFTSRFYFIEV